MCSGHGAEPRQLPGCCPNLLLWVKTSRQKCKALHAKVKKLEVRRSVSRGAGGGALLAFGGQRQSLMWMIGLCMVVTWLPLCCLPRLVLTKISYWESGLVPRRLRVTWSEEPRSLSESTDSLNPGFLIPASGLACQPPFFPTRSAFELCPSSRSPVTETQLLLVCEAALLYHCHGCS